MEEIKFMAFWIKDKVMTTVDTLIFQQGGIFVEDGCSHRGYENKDCKLLRYTGKKDEKGKGIYEEDIVITRTNYKGIVKFGTYEDTEEGALGHGFYIEFEDATITSLNDDSGCQWFKVIGTNAELLY